MIAQWNGVLAGITQNEIENRHRLDYVVFPGRTLWSHTRPWRNFYSFFGFGTGPKYDWRNVYEVPRPERPTAENIV